MLEGTQILWDEYLDYYGLQKVLYPIKGDRYIQTSVHLHMSLLNFLIVPIRNCRTIPGQPMNTYFTLQYWDLLPVFEEIEMVYIDPAI